MLSSSPVYRCRLSDKHWVHDARSCGIMGATLPFRAPYHYIFQHTCSTEINQSFNRTSIAPISPAKPGAVARQPNQCSTAKSRNSSVTSTGHWACRYLWGKGQVKEMSLQLFLKDCNRNGQTDRQREVVLKRWGTRVKSSCTCAGLDSRDRQTIIIV